MSSVQSGFTTRLPSLPVVNTTSETIPPGAVLAIAGVPDQYGRIPVGKPTSNNQLGCLVNGPTPILPASSAEGSPFGTAYYETPIPVAYKTADGTPVAHESWGAESGQWYLKRGHSGFVIHGGFDAASKTVVAVRTGSAASQISLEVKSAVSVFQRDAIGQIHTQSIPVYVPTVNSRPVGTNSIEGTVTVGGSPAANRVVVIQYGGYSWSATTNVAGEYNIQALPGGTYAVQLLAAPGESATWVQSITLPTATPVVDFTVTV